MRKPRYVADVSGARLATAALLAALGIVAVGSSLGCGTTKRSEPSATREQRRTSAPGEQQRAVQRAVETRLVRWRHSAYWAHARRAAPVRAAPESGSRAVARLHFETEDGFPEVYLVLARRSTPAGDVWLKIAVPMRPNGTTGWVLPEALGPLHAVSTWLVVDRRSLRLSFFSEGKRRFTAPVGVGKPSTPTPTGLFWVREQFVLDDQAFYGPYAFGTSAYASVSDWPGGGVVGLHGTSLPHLIPGRPSHGCIRLRNPDILWLAQHVPVGTPVAVVN
jgi:hypothetical protein